MFSLIISIIAIALVAALALASIYYGGDAFQEGTAKAEASTVINQGQQVQAAVTMSEIDEQAYFEGANVAETSLNALVTGDYLKEVPGVRDQNWEKVASEDFITMDVVNADVCEYIEEAFDGVSTVPSAREDQAFGCFGDGTTHTAYYKL
tara:strand:- start:30 stop:479 length:450 start_codon:yes stop_codon:yes gene_type:complete